jgi:hypothetical protein
MSNLSDKELDRLSREAADSYEPDTSSLSWSRLEQKLAQQMPERPPDGLRLRRISPYVWGPAVVLLAGLSFFLIKNISYSPDSTRKTQSVNQTIPSSASDDKQSDGNTLNPEPDGISSPAESADSKNGNTDLGIQVNPSAGGVAKSIKTDPAGRMPSDSKYKESATAGNTNGVPSGGNLSGAPNSRSDRGISKAVVPGSIAVGADLSSGKTGEGHNELLNANASDANTGSDKTGPQGTTGTGNPAGTEREKNMLSLPALALAGKGPGTVSGNDSLLKQIAQSKKAIPNKSLRLNRSLNFGLSFGPDYTDGGGISNNQIGNNIGITIGYYLTDKLSVNTGIFYSNKFYWANGHGYNRPQPVSAYASTYAAPPPIDYVNGSCNMWEIPLTLRYDFARKEKTRFFANAGLSSYFMMKQNFIYFIHTNQQRLAAWKTSNNEQINYWFSVADISLGFETEVGKGVSFQAEPFVKLPLKNMGAENLKLNSYGFLLSFRYTPVLNRTRK